jgi:hypothetical protein
MEMSLVMKISIMLSIVVLALGTVACDFSPTAPFEGFNGEALEGASQGATLHGTFTGSGGSATALRAFAASTTDDLIVIVYDLEDKDLDNEIGRVQVVGGSFTIRGLAEDFILVFWDPNAEGDNKEVGRETFEGVKPNQEIDIKLTIDEDSGQVVLLEERRTGIDHQAGEGIEIEGKIGSIEVYDSLSDWSGSLLVNGYDFRIYTRNAQTSIRKGNRSLTLSQLEVGDQVHVRGVFVDVDGEMHVFAHEIKLQEEEEDEIESDGKVVICHIPPGNPDNAKTIEVSADAVPAHLAHGDTLGACPND